MSVALALAPRNTEVHVLERTDTYVVATWRRLGLLIWQGEASVAGIERSSELIGSWADGRSEPVALLVVVPARHTRPPTDECRAAMQRVAASGGEILRGTATLVDVEGFIAATVRLVMMPFMSRAAGSAPNVFQKVAAAADWAAALLDDPYLHGPDLANAIHEARAR